MTNEKTIDGVAYTISMMPIEKAQKTLHKLMRLIFPSVGNLVGVVAGFVGGEKEDGKSILDRDFSDFNFDNLSKTLRELFSTLNEDEAPILCKELIDGNVIGEGCGAVTYTSAHIREKGLLHMYKICAAVIEVNFKDFLQEIVKEVSDKLGGLKGFLSSSEKTTEATE